MKLRLKEALVRLNVKQKVIMFYATIGIAATTLLIGYTLNECFKELYTVHAIVITNQTRPDSQVDEVGGEGTEQRTEDVRVAEFSAYTSEEAQTDSTPYITADGTDLRGVYTCVVASNSYEFGTKLAIEDLGVCEVHDRMNSRYDEGHIDVYFGNDKKRALEFGRKTLSYIVIE